MSEIDVVAQAKADLLAAGENLDGPCGAHKITATAGWRLRDKGWGVVFSTGNGCDIESTGERYRGDSLMLKDGTTKDCLLYAENREGKVYPEIGHDEYNIPAWNDVEQNQPPENWRPPYDPGFVPSDSNGDTDEPDSGLSEEQVAAINLHTTAEADRVVEEVKANTQVIKDTLERMSNQVEQAVKILVLLRDRPEPTRKK